MTFVRFEKVGDTRRNTITLRPGKCVAFPKRGTMVVEKTCVVDVTKKYCKVEGYLEPRWEIKNYFLDTIREPPPSWWGRLFKRKPELPAATLVSKD